MTGVQPNRFRSARICKVCGRRIADDNTWGICSRTDLCLRSRRRMLKYIMSGGNPITPWWFDPTEWRKSGLEPPKEAK